jgi:hypothetical protein
VLVASNIEVIHDLKSRICRWVIYTRNACATCPEHIIMSVLCKGPAGHSNSESLLCRETHHPSAYVVADMFPFKIDAV